MTWAGFQEVDGRLVEQGLHPSSDFWLETFERFYTHPTARTLVARVGRGGAKSFHVAKFAVCELLFGDWAVPPGERHWFVIVSVRQDEAAQRLVQVETMLRLLGVASRRSDNKLELVDLPLGVIVLPATIGGVSGYRCIGAALDEAAKWRAADSAANPAKEVHASIRAMQVTHKRARTLVVSSAFGVLDEHHRLFELGNTEHQVVACATSWEANPDAITEAQTRIDEPDERVWLREYASIPQAEASAAYPPAKVHAAFRPLPTEDGLTPAVAFGVDDPSSGRRDSWTSGVARFYFRRPVDECLTKVTHELVPFRDGTRLHPFTDYVLDDKGQRIPNPAYKGPTPPLLAFEHVEETAGAFWQGLPASELVRRRAEMYRKRGVLTVFGDQREAYLLQSAYAQHGVTYVPLAWTAENKIRAVERVRRWLAEETIILPPNDKLKRQLLTYQEKLTASGHITYDGKNGDDFTALLVTCALAELEGLLPASPIQRRASRNYDHLPVI